MSEFTYRLKDVLELERFDAIGPSVIGLQSYPLFDPAYRDALNEKIIRRYFLQEIGHESIAIFRHAMNREMHEIMPYYNKLYESDRLNIDPLNTVNLSTLSTGEFTSNTDNTSDANVEGSSTSGTKTTATGDVTSDSTTGATAGAESLNMEYPQQQLDTDGRYATSGSKSESASNSTTDGTEHSDTSSDTNGNEQSETLSSQVASTTADGDSRNDTKQTGWTGSQAELLMRYRESFLNIDAMVLDSLQKLFMGTWGNGGAEYADRSGYGGYGRYGRFIY